MDLNREYTYDVESRLKRVVWIIAVFFILVGLRLFYLQVVRGEYYRVFSENNSIKDITIPAARGMIFDKNGEIIVENRPVFDLVVVPQYISSRGDLAATLSDILGVDPDGILEALKNTSRLPSYKPYTLMPDVDMDVVARVRARMLPFGNKAGYNLDGVDIRYRYVREYSRGDIASHALGYVREVDKGRLKKLEGEVPGAYRSGDYIGINGVEEVCDLSTRGKEGLMQKVVDALGREVNYPDISLGLISQPAESGGDIYLTLYLNLQEVAKLALAGRRGAVVAIDPSDGAVLAMYSSPGYDLERLHSPGRNEYWAELVGDSNMPLYNRAIGGTYPPASTYKIVTAVAALEEKVVDKKGKVLCHGGLKYGDRLFGCWRRGGHGAMDIVHGLAQSCDVFFYTMGLRLGIDKLAKYAKLFGLGAETGIELPGEKKGLIPTTDWKLKARKAAWNKSETLSAAIGQGYDLVTPLQMALVGAEVANGGYRVVPHLVEKILTPAGDYLYRWSGRREKIKGISDETLEIVREGLIGVVEGPGGTAGRLKPLGLKIAGKTGTAQVVSRESEKGGEIHRSHAWFVGYAPYDRPVIAVAAIVEHGGHGSSAAAPIVGEVIREYLKEEEKVAGSETKE